MNTVTHSIIVSLGWCLAACGQLRDPWHEADSSPAPVVRMATPTEVKSGQVVPHSYIVTFRSQVGATLLKFASFRDEYSHHYSYLSSDFRGDTRVRDLRYLATVDLANPAKRGITSGLAKIPSPLRLAWDQSSLAEMPAAITAVDFASHEDAQSMLAAWEAEGAIWFAEPNYTNRLMDNPFTEELAERYKSAGIWWHEKINLPEALSKLSTANINPSQTPVIAVLDSGVDIEHPALKDKIFTNPTPGVSGCVDDVHGCDTTQATRGNLGVGTVIPYGLAGYNQNCLSGPNPADASVCEHGTHVSGIIAAELGINTAEKSTLGLSTFVGGVCPVCKILPVKIISNIEGQGSASDESIINAMQYVALFRNAGRGAVRVVNSSFGKYTSNRAVELLVNVLSQSASQILVVAAASNEDSMLRSYPAAYPGVVGVSATGPEDEKATYSNFGPWVKVSAPGGNNGTDIDSTVPGGTTKLKKGTSMASPVVAGVAGLVLAYDPDRSVDALRNSIIATADKRVYDPDINNGINYLYYDPLVAGSPQRWPLLGSGIVNAAAALDGKSASYSGGVYDRVQPGCGTVGAQRSESKAWWLILLPLVLVLL
ncbi:MAG: hypothetical protein FJ146_04830 [Deltaproteobacteria bacterium]|nr:hypothetical protein [Deltaproteobacteria bacterium]